MVVGFNHNVRYRGQLFHVQTEDSGLKNPHIITLLYIGGTIISSQKTSYADISKIDNLEAVVEDLMKEQHKEMLRRLKNGDFDQNIERLLSGKLKPDSASEPAPEKTDLASTQAPVEAPKETEEKKAAGEESLDEIILSYLVGDDSKT